MVELTIQVPDELAERLDKVGDRLTEVLEVGLQVVMPPVLLAYEEVTEFLTSNPTPEAIVSFQPSEAVQQRVSTLIEKNRLGLLAPTEEAELKQYDHIEHLMRMAKGHALVQLKEAA